MNSRSVWERLRVSGTAENRFLAPRNKFWGPRAQRQARLKTGPPRFPVALSQKIIAHLTFSLFLKFLGCYSELPEAPDNEKIEETMKNQTCLTSRSYSHCLSSHKPPDNGRGGGFAVLLRGRGRPCACAWRTESDTLTNLLIFLSCS